MSPSTPSLAIIICNRMTGASGGYYLAGARDTFLANRRAQALHTTWPLLHFSMQTLAALLWRWELVQTTDLSPRALRTASHRTGTQSPAMPCRAVAHYGACIFVVTPRAAPILLSHLGDLRVGHGLRGGLLGGLDDADGVGAAVGHEGGAEAQHGGAAQLAGQVVGGRRGQQRVQVVVLRRE